MLDIALALGGVLFGLHILSLLLAWRKCHPRRRLPAVRARVTLVRPVCGLEFQIERTLRSSFEQDYADYDVIFCVARADDSAVNLVRNLIEAYPFVNARLLVGDTRLSQNPKLNNMAKAWTSATGDIVIFADSNLLLPPDYCESVAAAFAEGEPAVVSAPPVGDFAESFFGEVECAMLNTHAARWQFAASGIGMDFAQGKTLAFRVSAFGDDLMRELATEPAEDAAATKIVRRMGRRLNVLAPAYAHPVGRRSFQSVWARHVRWARLRRRTFPFIFALEAGCGMFPALLAFALSPTLQAIPFPVVVAATAGAWYMGEYALARSLGWRANAWFVPACLVRDSLLPAFYAAAWVNDRFEWRGHAMDNAVKQPVA